MFWDGYDVAGQYILIKIVALCMGSHWLKHYVAWFYKKKFMGMAVYLKNYFYLHFENVYRTGVDTWL